ncbi:MAG: hypothetical protein HQL79_12105 [Magnetococcales bacterium]|nr:hypothetical protein [Magnetococcales bacterium]
MMHHRISYSLLTGFFPFIVLAFLPVTPGSAETDILPVEKRENVSSPQLICEQDIMALCHREIAQTKGKSKLNDQINIDKIYIKC